jgi:NADH-quinone oxidoreductase subunit J
MLLNAGKELRTHGSIAAFAAGFPGAAAIFCLLTLLFLAHKRTLGLTHPAALSPQNGQSNIAALSTLLFRDLLLPFEVTSILILVAILGAVVLAHKEEN